jgi:hypothetical protein
MKTLKTFCFLAISGLLFVTTANAATVNVNLNSVGDTADSYFQQTTTGLITDYIDLTIGSTFNLMAVFGGFTTNEFNAATSTWALYFDDGNDLDAGGADVLLGSGGLLDAQPQYFDIIAPGNYYIKLVSDVTALLGGEARTQYQLTATVVPVPAALWLFGSALVAFVGFGRRSAA